MAFEFGGSDTEQRDWSRCFSRCFGTVAVVVVAGGGVDGEATEVEYDDEEGDEVC